MLVEMDECWVSLVSIFSQFSAALASLERQTETLLLEVSAKVFPLTGEASREVEEGESVPLWHLSGGAVDRNLQRDIGSGLDPLKADCHGLLSSINLSEVQIMDVMGYGACGVVHRALYRGSPVAVKLHTFSAAEADEEQELLKSRCLTEIKLGSRLKHPNVIAFVGAAMNNCKPLGSVDRSDSQGGSGCRGAQQWAMVTELLEGGNLRTFLDQQYGRRLPSTQVLRMALDIARGMEYLHRSGVMHRDLKSPNLLLNAEGRVKIADFGCASYDPKNITSTTIEAGTVRWMAPEMMEGRPYTHKVDVYAFGIILWELCTTAMPFAGGSIVQIANAVTLEAKRPPTEDLAPSLVRIMSKCWSKSPEDRPSFGEVVRWLETEEAQQGLAGAHHHR